MLIDNFY